MSLLVTLASLVPAALALGGGLYKLGSGLLAMAQTVKDLVAYHEDHERRLQVLETAAASRARPRKILVSVTIEIRSCNGLAMMAYPARCAALTCDPSAAA